VTGALPRNRLALQTVKACARPLGLTERAAEIRGEVALWRKATPLRLDGGSPSAWRTSCPLGRTSCSTAWAQHSLM
jgi:hypothetical protein